MADCTCARCQLAKASDGDLEELEAELAGLLAKADDGGEEFDFELDPEDAEIMGTVFGVLGSGIGGLGVDEKRGVELTAADYAAAIARMEAQLGEGLALLSDSARTRLGPVLDRVNILLADMAQGRNAIEAGARMQELLTWVEGQGGGIAEGAYSPYEWSRLARTEAVFARTAAERAAFERDGVSTDAIDKHGSPPLHPQCMCGLIEAENPEGQRVVVVDTTPMACDACMDWADEIMATAGF